jgi:hypothetical protein
MTTKWLKTSETQILDPNVYLFTNGGFTSPHPVVISGDGTVYYVSIGEHAPGSGLLRYKYENNAWTSETFIATNGHYFTGTKYLPNSTYTYPVATSSNGNTLVLIKNGFADNPVARTIIITSYINGQFVQVGPEITFTKQLISTFNYYISRVYMSGNGLKIVIVTFAGINTLVFSNGIWNLLPNSPDINIDSFTPTPYAAIASAAYMSKNGMYLTLLSVSENSVLVFKFDTQLNNWILFKSISNDIIIGGVNYQLYINQTFVSNTGVVLVVDGWGKLYRFEYSLTTNSYVLIAMSPNEGTPWDSTPSFVSDDCNTYFCRYRYFGMYIAGQQPDKPIQVLRMLKWKNENWEIVEFPSSLVPYVAGNQDGGTFGSALGISSDGMIPLATTPFSANKSKIITYLNISVPTLHLGDMVKIKEADVNFNEANVFVKDPTVALNVSNKQYVDIADEEVRALILASATTDTTSTTEYYDLLGERQTVQSNLAVQIEQLYQYFFNQSRSDANII